MAFNPSNLISYNELNAGGMLWRYSTSDNLSSVETSGYFTPPVVLREKDVVAVTANDGKRVYYYNGGALTSFATVSAFPW